MNDDHKACQTSYWYSIEEDIEDHLGDLIHEIDGCELKSMKVLKGERR